jgi:hypothetical protein
MEMGKVRFLSSDLSRRVLTEVHFEGRLAEFSLGEDPDLYLQLCVALLGPETGARGRDENAF